MSPLSLLTLTPTTTSTNKLSKTLYQRPRKETWRLLKSHSLQLSHRLHLQKMIVTPLIQTEALKSQLQ